MGTLRIKSDREVEKITHKANKMLNINKSLTVSVYIHRQQREDRRCKWRKHTGQTFLISHGYHKS